MKTNYNVLNIEAVKGKYRFTDEESFPDIFGIPLFEISDALLEEIYYFRWSIYGKHITKTADGYVVTEFLPKVPWAGKHNTIPCPAHHHFYEGRWIHNREILSDYATFWFTPDATPRKYSFPAADSIYKTAQAWGDFSLPEALYEKLKENYEGWEKSNKTESGLFYQTDNRDGMELSISGNGIRPTINSYMYADALALFNIAKRCGRCDDAALFENKAKELRELINDTLWDSNAKFYKTLSECNDYKIADVRELIGYIPWCYGIADEEKAEAWKFLRDENHFDAPYGPTTAERCHPDFMKPHTHECWWNGPSWPFATSQTLGAMIEHIKSFDSPCIDRFDFYEILRRYAASHFINEGGIKVPFIDENLHPFTGKWLARDILQSQNPPRADRERGKDYNHSSFCDIVIRGIAGVTLTDDEISFNPIFDEHKVDFFCLDGIRYKDSFISIVFDKYGDKYKLGTGFHVFLNGKKFK